MKFREIPGITPAGAGKTWRDKSRRTNGRDHPRRCGENDLSQRMAATVQGSPPQVRGKRDNNFICRCQRRITPAGAGKTRSANLALEPAADHPRRCGENTLLCAGMHCSPGSPPQVRGKPHNMGIISVLSRITPAGAGKTAWGGVGCYLF